MGSPLCVVRCFPLAAFNICSLCLIFVNLINMCLGVFKAMKMGFPGGSVVKHQPANAGDMGSISDPGRFHMQLSSGATTIKPVL